MQGTYEEEDQRVFVEYKAELSNGQKLCKSFWSYSDFELMSLEDMKKWPKPRKMLVTIKVGIYRGRGYSYEWQTILTSIDDFKPICHRNSNQENKMLNLLNTSKYSDVKLLTDDGETIMAHKCILSTNAYFDAIFRFESNKQVIQLESHLKAMMPIIAFIYTGKIDPNNVYDWQELYKLSTFYLLDDLARHCELQIITTMKKPICLAEIKKLIAFALFWQAFSLKKFLVKVTRRIQIKSLLN